MVVTGTAGIMARSRSSLGLFGIFGRSADLRQLDQAALLKDHAIGPEPAPQAYRAAAEILAYCMIGADAFAGANDGGLTDAVERRIETALDKPEALDAQLILLTVHAKVIQPSVVHQFQIESATD
jgi:hypothetical protein